MALEALAGIEGRDSDEKLILWLESEKDETEVQENREKGKQREKKIDGMEEDENGMEGVEYHKWSLTICDGCFDTLKSLKMQS